jgi:flagellar hook-length control protein FliK
MATLPAASSAKQASEPTPTLVSRIPDGQGTEPEAKPAERIPEEHGREPIAPAPSPTGANPARHAKAVGKTTGPAAQASQSQADQAGASLILTGLDAISQPLATPLTVQVATPARVPELIPRAAAAVQGRDAGVQTGTKSPEDVATQRQIDPSAQSNASVSVDVPSDGRIGRTEPASQPATSVDVSDIVSTSIQPQALNSISPQAAASPASDPSRAGGPAGDPPAPVDQLAPALISTLKTMGDGTQTVTVRLQPPELGQVQIRVDQTSAGIARVDILAERPETVVLLQRDQPRLDQALDQAGILSAGRSVSFQVGTQTQISDAPRTSGMAAGDSDRGQSGGSGQQSADNGGEPDAGSNPDQQQARARWFRAGLDILA